MKKFCTVRDRLLTPWSIRAWIFPVEAKDLFNHRLAQVPRDEDAHPFAVVVLGESDKGREDFLAQQDRGNDYEYSRRLAPAELRPDQGVDCVHRPVQHDGVDLLRHGSYQGKDEGDEHQQAVWPHERSDVAEKLEKVHEGRALGLMGTKI